MKFVYHDGGRAIAGYRGSARDCVVRAIAIATGLPYRQVYRELGVVNASKKDAKTPRLGVHTDSQAFKNYMDSLGFEYVSLYRKGIKMHAHHLPVGTIILNLTKHYATVIDGVLYDIYNCQNTSWVDALGVYHEDKRTVFGYWKKKYVA